MALPNSNSLGLSELDTMEPCVLVGAVSHRNSNVSEIREETKQFIDVSPLEVRPPRFGGGFDRVISPCVMTNGPDDALKRSRLTHIALMSVACMCVLTFVTLW